MVPLRQSYQSTGLVQYQANVRQSQRLPFNKPMAVKPHLNKRNQSTHHEAIKKLHRSIPADFIWAALWQNQQSDCAPSEDSDQPGHSPSLIRVIAIRMKKAWVLSYLLSAQRMPRLVWGFAGRTVILLVLPCCGSISQWPSTHHGDILKLHLSIPIDLNV